MKRIFAAILTTLLIIAMTLVAMFVLVYATLKVTAIQSPVQRAAAIGAEIVLGIVLLLGTVWLATHLAVRIFRVQQPPSPGGPLA
jgi:heme/copper-type cytochrome/quinol oxidase subunit 2